jgi:hypothetical protein
MAFMLDLACARFYLKISVSDAVITAITWLEWLAPHVDRPRPAHAAVAATGSRGDR